MNERQSFEGIQYYRNPSNGDAYYFPDAAAPQTDSNGDPIISLIGAGPQWFLQVSTKWAVPDIALDKLTDHLISQEIIQSRVDLKQAPLKVENAELILFLDGEERVLASSKTSGHYPFVAAFNTTISEQLQKDVAAAFNGKKDTLYVNYYATLDSETPIEMKISGPIHSARESLSGKSQPEEIIKWIDRQIGDNRFRIEIIADEDISEETIQRVQENLIRQAVEEIQSYLSNETETPDDSHLMVSRQEGFGTTEKIISRSDISTWFKNNSSDHIKIIK